ncbi:uncharacterized protein LOC133815329 [Humulus lupulus]|uniref:uncharacterized protein LOC133815329 n=1 Tax=Humulus lupulus TaxID=3486 RepID=UPI002B416F2B|nr:uncharacterized protein LOC133815329 [Humulus lupulus]
MTMGLIMVKFNDEATRDHVLENGVLQFDRKPVIIRPWTVDLSAIRLIRSVPLWIHLHDLGLQYWGSKCISALFARVLVEMEITDNPPRSIQFINEYGQIMEQGIEYEWLPTKCKSCSGFGHSMVDCRKEHKTHWVKKEDVAKPEVTDEKTKISEGPSNEKPEGLSGAADVEDNSVQQSKEVHVLRLDKFVQLMEPSKGEQWITPKRVATQARQGLIIGGSTLPVVQVQKQINQFVVLQEQKKGAKKVMLELVFPMDNCNLLSWNLRGLNKTNKHIVVLDSFSRNKIGVGGLLETKMRGNKIVEFMENKLPNWEFYSSPTIESRLLIIWRKVFVRLTILEESPQFVHCMVNLAGQRGTFYVIFVYRYNLLESRRSLWQGLNKISLSVRAWIVLGDFNAPFSGLDRSGGKPVSGLELADPLSWLADTKVEALKSISSYFTWTNNQEGSARIYSKIDHVFMNEEWLDLFPHSLAVFSWEVVSDHCSCVVTNIQMEKLGVKFLRFYNFRTGHSYFKEVVMNSWRAPLKATGLRAIYLKLMRLKHRLKKFNRDTIGDIGLNYHLAKEAYQEAQLKAQYYPHDHRLQEVVKEKAAEFTLQEHIADNRISTYITEQGTLIDAFREVVTHFVDHFKSYLGSPSSATGRIDLHCMEMESKLSVEQRLLLLKPFSSKEIKDAFFGIPSTKSPGPDGFGSGFFKELWQEIGKDVCSAIVQGFAIGQFPSKLHETTLSLSNQGAFVRGRSIAHNIMIFQDLIKNYDRAVTSPRCAIKIDLSKAYDIVDWQFLEGLLRAFCFPMKFVCWIMTCVRNTSYSLLLNGRVQGSFKGKKGLRQGDPMSPLLFVLIMEYLTRSLQLAARASTFRYHPMCNSLKLLNLCFADDLILFCKGSLSAVRIFKEALGKFSEATGLSINTNKSHIYFGGVNIAERMDIVQEIQLPEGSFPLRNYWMSVFILPQSIVKEVEKFCRMFLWGASGNRSKLHLASWHQVCLPKAYGGLGFRDGANWNRAVLAKYTWAVSEKQDLLWVKWIKEIYLKGNNFWNYALKPDSSWYWRKLCHLRSKFSKREVLAAGYSGKFKPSKLYNSTLNQQLVEYKQAVWCKTILPKHRFLLWQVVNAHLLIRDNLSRFNLQLNSFSCPVCEDHLESHTHLFFECCLSKMTINFIFAWLGFQAWSSNYNEWMVWLNSGRSGIMESILNMVLAAVIYSL